MERCKTCKWWAVPAWDDSEWGNCQAIGMYEPDGLAYNDDSPIACKADFGCVLHSPIPGTHGSGCGPGGDTLRGLRFTIKDNQEAKADG